MSWRKKSFSYRLSTDFVFITSILFLAALITAAFISYKLIADEATRSAKNKLDATVKEIEIEIQKVEDAVNGIAWLVEEHLDDPDYMYHITRKLVSESGTVFGSAVAFEPDSFEGMHYYSPYSFKDRSAGSEIRSIQLGNDDYDYFSMEWYRKAADSRQPCWSEPYVDEGGGGLEMSTYSRPVFDKEGKFKAVITADFYLGVASEIISRVQPYANSRTVLASASGKYIIDKDSPYFGLDILSSCKSIKDSRAIAAAEDMLGGQEGVASYKNNGNTSFLVYGPLKNGWSAAIVCDYKEVLRNAGRMQLILLIEAVLGLILLFLLCNSISHRLTRPLLDFEKSARGIAEGDFNTSLPQIDSDDEIKHLRDSFEYMQNSLNTYIYELKETTASKERIESELAIASQIQMGIVPHTFPDLGRVSLSAMLKPAREVGGDFYDCFLHDRDTVYFTIGDVSGKGVPAALVMAICISAFRFLSNLDLSISQLLTKMNDSLCDSNEANMFVTLLIGKIDLRTGRMSYCNAGHNPPVLIGHDGKAGFLGVKPNIAIGLLKEFKYEEQEIDLAPGSRMLFYTDGVTEAETVSKAQYGEDRLLSWAGRIPSGDSAEAVCSSLYADVSTFTGDEPQNDDITIMTMKIE